MSATAMSTCTRGCPKGSPGWLVALEEALLLVCGTAELRGRGPARTPSADRLQGLDGLWTLRRGAGGQCYLVATVAPAAPCAPLHVPGAPLSDSAVPALAIAA